MGRFKDLTGQRFGHLLCLRKTDERWNNKIVWELQCDCGNKVLKRGGDLTSGKVTTCGKNNCIFHKNRLGEHRHDLSGQRFGKLTVKKFISSGGQGTGGIWECECDCGSIIQASAHQLLFGNKKSCGCLQSLGEFKIKQSLEELKIPFIKEKTFPELVSDNNVPLRFDFYLPQYNLIIEYDGEQHFFGWQNDSQSLKNNQYWDKIKNNYCQNNNILLIRIPYTEKEKINASYIQNLIEGIIND